MPFIGKSPKAGNYIRLDSITTSATATYNLTRNSTAYFPASARNLIVSLNGITQAPDTAYSVSGSTITFASALTSNDVIDYILVLGDVLSIGTPADNTVGESQLSYPLTNFSSTGIDDNASATQITIESGGDVGIGVTNPSVKLDVREESTGSEAAIQIYNTDNTNATTQSARLRLGPDTRGASVTGIEAIKENADFSTNAGRDASLVLYSMLNNSEKEAVRITSSGNVGIGTTTPAQVLDVSGTAVFGGSNTRLTTYSDSTYSGIFNGSSLSSDEAVYMGGDHIFFAANGGLLRITGHSIYRSGSFGSGLHLTTNAVIPANESGSVSSNTEDLGTTSYRWKDLYLSGGAYLGGTVAANKLDDYEEGTWTPTSSSNISSIADANGHYTKIGNVVTLMFYATITPTSSSSNMALGGLPYAVADKLTGTNVEGTGVIFEDSKTFMLWAQGNSSTIIIELDRPLQGSADTTNRSYRGSVVYYTT